MLNIQVALECLVILGIQLLTILAPISRQIYIMNYLPEQFCPVQHCLVMSSIMFFFVVAP